jgi:hypothetical protein
MATTQRLDDNPAVRAQAAAALRAGRRRRTGHQVLIPAALAGRDSGVVCRCLVVVCVLPKSRC